MKIALMSDLHQDFRRNEYDHYNKIYADVIVIAGDLQEGDGMDTLSAYVKNDQHVIFVPGNHEYYHHEINATRLAIRNSGYKYGINVLDRNVKVIGNVRFVGCTLWTDYKIYGIDKEFACKYECYTRMNDYQVIKDSSVIRRWGEEIAQFTPDAAQQIHYDDLAWLNSVLHEFHAGPTVVVTHHAPSYSSINAEYRGSREFSNAGYASNLDTFILKHQPEYWLHGHTHKPADYTINNTRVLCNPRGYTNENQGFEPKIFEV